MNYEVGQTFIFPEHNGFIEKSRKKNVIIFSDGVGNSILTRVYEDDLGNGIDLYEIWKVL